MVLFKYFKSLFGGGEKVVLEYDENYRRLLGFDNTKILSKIGSLESGEEGTGHIATSDDVR